MWFTSPFAVEEELVNGTLSELRRRPESIPVVMYSMARRTRSPLALLVRDAIRDRIQALHKSDSGQHFARRAEATPNLELRQADYTAALPPHEM
jgi:hypothetical protein